MGLLVNSLMTWLFIHLAITCQAKKTNIGHLNMKINRLSRVTDVLQKDVNDIWTVISTSGMETIDFGNKTRTGDLKTREEGVIAKVNGTVTGVQELKSEVEHLILYSRNGLKNEKRWQREAIRNLKQSYSEFETNLTKENIKINNQLESFHTEALELKEANEDNQLKMETINHNINERISKTEKEIEVQGVANEHVSKMLESLSQTQTELKQESQETTDRITEMQRENQQMKGEIADLQEKLNAIFAVLKKCDENWTIFEDHCYHFVNGKKTWHEALEFCQHENSYLLEVTSDLELEFAADLGHWNVLWIGASDIQQGYEGTFVYQESKRDVPQKFWADGEPNNAKGQEHCIEMYSSNKRNPKFNDVPCTFYWRFICEKPAKLTVQ